MRLLAALVILAAGTAHAQDQEYGLSAGVSTLGLTLEPSMRLNDRWGLRAPFGAGALNLDDDSNGQEYSGDLDMSGIGVMGDYYPFRASGFRVSAGAFYSDYSADLKSDSVTFGDISSAVTARIRQRQDVMPAIAVGYDGDIGQNGIFALTLGGLFGDGFDVSASESSGTVDQSLVDAEVQDIRDDLGGLDVIPYISVSVGFRF